MSKTQKIMTAVIIVLAVLLLITSSALAYVIIFGTTHMSTGRDTVTDNLITPGHPAVHKTDAFLPPMLASAWFVLPFGDADETLELYKGHPDDNTPFDVRNMFPGDMEEKTYCVKISYTGTLTVHFNADIREGYEKLAEVLECSVLMRSEKDSDGTLLYSGLMKDMPESVDVTVSNGRRVTEKLYYDIKVSLDTSVGNEYQRQMLIADFIWWADCDQGGPSGPIVPIVTTTEGDVTEPDVTTTDSETEPDVTTEVTTDDEVTTKPEDESDTETTSDAETTTEPDVTTESDTVTTTDDDTEPDIEDTTTTETTAPDEITDRETTSSPDDNPETGNGGGELISPSTGNSFAVICIMLLSFIVAVIVVLMKRRKEERNG